MELANATPRRTRKRKFPRDESAQPSAFPSTANSTAESIRENAQEKKEVKTAIAEIPEIFTTEQVMFVFDVYVGAISFIYSLILKTDFTAINDELKMEEEQKRLLAEPLAKVCSKYAPAEWAGATAEIQVISMLGIWTATSFQRARNVQKQLEEKKRDAERTRPVQDIRREPQREIHVPA